MSQVFQGLSWGLGFFFALLIWLVIYFVVALLVCWIKNRKWEVKSDKR